MSLSTRIFIITLALFIPPCPNSTPHLPEQDTMPQFAQLSPPLSDMPVLLNLAQTFTQASLGLQKDVFQDWIKENPLDNSMEALRAFVIKFQEAVLNDINRLNQTLQQDVTFPYFLSETLKFSVMPSKPFHQTLYDCASQHGFLPYGMHFLHNVIDQQHVPSPIYISQKPIFRSVDPAQWQKTISDSSGLCSIWQISDVTEQAEIKAQPDCNQALPSICLQSVGTRTYSTQFDHQTTKQQLLASSQHLFYLLTQLLTYPSPQKHFASDISLHLTEAFEIFAYFIENKADVSYQALFASKRCIDLIQLALQKAQHSEGWKAEERQQSNFEAIQNLLNNHTLLIKSMESRFQSLESKQRQHVRLRKGDSIDDPSSPEGSGSADRLGPNHNPAHDKDNDVNDNVNDDGSDHHDNVHTSNHQDGANDTNSDNDDGSDHHDNVHASNHQDGANDTNSDNRHDDGSDHHDNVHAHAGNHQEGDNDTNDQHVEGDDATWTWSSLFSWEFWFSQAQNHTESSQNQDSESQLELFDSSRNESFPSYIYSKFQMVHFWPFPSLLTLAAFHLINIIDFYINLLWKVFTVLLAVYVYTLDQRVSKLEEKCVRLNQPAPVELAIHAGRIEHLSSRHARRAHQNQQCPSSDPQCDQPLLSGNR